jgi:hypothetical protein
MARISATIPDELAKVMNRIPQASRQIIVVRALQIAFLEPPTDPFLRQVHEIVAGTNKKPKVKTTKETVRATEKPVEPITAIERAIEPVPTLLRPSDPAEKVIEPQEEGEGGDQSIDEGEFGEG